MTLLGNLDSSLSTTHRLHCEQKSIKQNKKDRNLILKYNTFITYITINYIYANTFSCKSLKTFKWQDLSAI